MVNYSYLTEISGRIDSVGPVAEPGDVPLHEVAEDSGMYLWRSLGSRTAQLQDR